MSAFLKTMTEAALLGGRQAAEKQLIASTVSDTGGGSLTTDQDQSAQDSIFDFLRSQVPGCNIIGEEGDAHTLASDAFIVDPIDGTVNYARGGADWCCTIAHKNGADIDTGVIYQPGHDLLAFAQREPRILTMRHGINDIALPPPPSKFVLAQSVIQMALTGQFSDAILEEVQLPLIKNTRFVRNVFCNTASVLELLLGICDAFIGYGSIWDFAAGKVLVELQGGVTGTVWGEPMDVNLIAPQRIVFARTQEIFDMIIPFTSRWPKENNLRY